MFNCVWLECTYAKTTACASSPWSSSRIKPNQAESWWAASSWWSMTRSKNVTRWNRSVQVLHLHAMRHNNIWCGVCRLEHGMKVVTTLTVRKTCADAIEYGLLNIDHGENHRERRPREHANVRAHVIVSLFVCIINTCFKMCGFRNGWDKIVFCTGGDRFVFGITNTVHAERKRNARCWEQRAKQANCYILCCLCNVN